MAQISVGNLTTRSTGRASRCALGLPSLRSAPLSASVRPTECAEEAICGCEGEEGHP